MRSRCMSLLPRTTLHNDSEHVEKADHIKSHTCVPLITPENYFVRDECKMHPLPPQQTYAELFEVFR